MTHHFKISVHTLNLTFKASYRNKKFRKIELLTGTLKDDMLSALGKIIPPNEEKIPDYNNKWSDRLSIEIIAKDTTIREQFVDAWFTFYQNLNGFPPKFNAIQGKQINGIKKHLTTIDGTEQGSLNLWHFILDNWNKLDKFHQAKTDLKYINGNINIILTNVKKHAEKNTYGDSDSVEL